jgi:hypothetical protein
MSVKELVSQNICHHHFLKPWGVRGEGAGDTCAHRAIEYSSTLGFAVSDRFLTTFFDPNMGHTLGVFYTLPEERRQSMIFKKNA